MLIAWLIAIFLLACGAGWFALLAFGLGCLIGACEIVVYGRGRR